MLRRGIRDQLDPIAERIFRVATDRAGKLVGRTPVRPGYDETSDELVVVVDDKRRMRFHRRAHLGLDAEMDRDATGVEPQAAPRPERLGFLDLGEPERAAVELARERFATRRIRELYVIDANDGHDRRMH